MVVSDAYQESLRRQLMLLQRSLTQSMSLKLQLEFHEVPLLTTNFACVTITKFWEHPKGKFGAKCCKIGCYVGCFRGISMVEPETLWFWKVRMDIISLVCSKDGAEDACRCNIYEAECVWGQNLCLECGLKTLHSWHPENDCTSCLHVDSQFCECQNIKLSLHWQGHFG